MRFFLFCIVCFSCFYGQAQNAENNRARDWLTLNRLTALAAIDSSFLSATEKTKLTSLVIDRSPGAACAKAAVASCSNPNAQSTGLKLTGLRLNNNLVNLIWQTTAEYNSRYFVLERRSLTDTLRFDSITAVAGKGVSNVKSTYAYADQNNLVSSWYRVKEVNLDSSFFYSNLVFIAGPASKLSVMIVPNPGNKHATGFFITGTNAPTASYTITNTAGAVLVKEERAGLTGNTFISLAGYQLNSGFYILTVVTDKEHTSKKFVLY